MRKVTYQVEVENEREISRKEVASEITKQPKKQIEIIGTKPKIPLTKGKGAQIFTDSKGVAHRETYYDLPMNIVVNACGGGGTYTVRVWMVLRLIRMVIFWWRLIMVIIRAVRWLRPVWVLARFMILAGLRPGIRMGLICD
ncbi:G5 domain-containing protein [Candidatus Minimicrobia naudis]|uniref:G5 domain-containing protein n=1 Tax=Candidatus Minimicrobia naudis TaxID=2841263 RepID=A0A8F1MB28_9BACT|nr:G5 domain-containing protein [Candidatus Minimicrobia naudis]